MRVPAEDGSWARLLPPLPTGASVTVTVSSTALRNVPADDLVSSGYRIAGVVDDPSAHGRGPAVLVLVLSELQQQHPTWFRALLGAAERALPCDLGPVQRAYATALTAHATARAATR